MASKLRTWYQAGYHLGDKYMKISSSSRNSRIKRIQDWANRCSFEVYNSLNETSLSRILDNIERKKPLFIRSYPDPLYILAQYRIRNKCYTHQPNYIMTTASTLSDHQRYIIQDAFGCSIIDSYSCEGTPNTFQTPGNNTYHVCQYYGIIEVLDDNGDPVINGTGHVVSTDLWNFAQPFIRYDTKDIVEVYNGDIVHIAGRSSECVKLPDGALLSANNLTAFFNKKVDVITAYRLVFHQNGNVEVFVVPTNLFSDADKQEIINYWGHRLKTQVTVNLTESLSQRKNGKFQTIINETID
jgi:phenylacetate-CoA ligase